MAIITISRQMGSGGDQIGSLVASILGYKLIDKSFLLAEAQKRGLIDAETANTMSDGKPGLLDHLDEQRIRGFYAIRSILKELASKDNMVIIGRGGHLELKDYTSIIRVRIIADHEIRITNLMQEKGISKGEARKLMNQNDKEQSEYIKHFFLTRHSDEKHYDLIINTSRISYSVCASVIIQAAREFGAMRITPQEI